MKTGCNILSFTNLSFFRACYNNLFVCKDFIDSWSGYRFRGAWTEQNCGGTPISGKQEANESWAKNPQYLIELDKTMDLFVSLGQPDGRLIPGETYPFADTIHHVMFSLHKLQDGESTPLKAFNQKRKPRPKMSTIKEYRELSEYWPNVEAGKYILVPR